MMRRNALRGAAAAAFWLLVWAALARAVDQPLLLPAPGAVLARLAVLMTQEAFLASLAGTLARTLLAYALGAAGALLLGLLCCRYALAEALFAPLLGAVRAAPVSSFIVLALVWLSAAGVPVLTGALMTLPILYGALVTAVRGVDPRLTEMARLYGLSPVQRLRRVWLPAVRPAVIGAGLNAIGLCWKAVVAAEVIGVPARAVGSRLYEAKIYLETDSLIAWTIAVVAMSVLLEKLLRQLAKRYAEVRHD